MGKYGLYRLKVDPETKEIQFVRLTKEGESVFRMGLGVLPGQDYRTGNKALYICGIIEEQYGFFRSFDEGRTWEKLNNDAQQFGDHQQYGWRQQRAICILYCDRILWSKIWKTESLRKRNS